MSADSWEELLHPAGVRRFAGDAGIWYHNPEGGIIECVTAPTKGVDANLFGCLKVQVDRMKIHIVISSVDTGKHARTSRHYAGLAVDICRIGPVGQSPVPIVTASSLQARSYVAWLLAHGYKIGEGKSNPGPGVLWGPVHSHYNPSGIGHSDHVHQSLGRK